MAVSFRQFHSRYERLFTTMTRSVVKQSLHYLSGLVQAVRKNIERMIEVVPGSEYQKLQHFISHSPWDHAPVIEQVARDADHLLGGSPESALMIDETAVPKKGKMSVGTARQWCGRLGKVDNCQVGVFGSLVRGSSSTLIDGRLYLPKEWTDDRGRCKSAGVPDDVQFKSKSQLALDIVRSARRLGIRFSWVGVDGGYGKEPLFLKALDDADEQFVADVHKSQTIYLEDPAPYVPEKCPGKGRTTSRYKTDAARTTVGTWAASQPEAAWRRMRIRDSTKGYLVVELLTRRVWVWLDKEQAVVQWHLVVRREAGARDKIKYSLSNAPAQIPLERLAYMQGQRYFVERSFQDGKGTTGLDHYQIRGWQSWHHHMAMVMMSMLFMLETRLEQKQDHPLLSCSDIAELLAHFLPRRDITPEEVFRQMQVRHEQRQASIDSAYARQKRAG